MAGWQIHHGKYAWMAYALAVGALGLAVWHLTRKPDVGGKDLEGR